MKRFPWRIALYLAFLGYIFADLKWCEGPLHSALMSRRVDTVSEAAKYRWVAIVNQEPITSEQLDLATFRHLYQRGKSYEDVPPKNLAMIRRAVLQTLIDDTIVKSFADGEKFVADPDGTRNYIESWKSQFATPEEMEERLALQNLSYEDMEAELTRVWSRKMWLEQRVQPAVVVTEEELRGWYDANRETGEGFDELPKFRARHIFLSTVTIEDDSKEKLAQELHAKLLDGSATFEELVKNHSEDERTKFRGGDLNWFAKDRLDEEFTDVVFAMRKGEVSEPFQTSIGWHIVEVMDVSPARKRTLEEMAPEIRSHLENERTAETIDILMEKLRKVSNIELFPEHI